MLGCVDVAMLAFEVACRQDMKKDVTFTGFKADCLCLRMCHEIYQNLISYISSCNVSIQRFLITNNAQLKIPRGRSLRMLFFMGICSLGGCG